MKTYYITCPIDLAEGNQVFTVKAESEAEALAIFKSSGGEWHSEEVEVVKLGQPTASETP